MAQDAAAPLFTRDHRVAIARKLLAQGRTQSDIQFHLRAHYGQGLHRETLCRLAKEQRGDQW